jgi:hypothetical protein
MVPSRYDTDFRQWVPTVNTDPARLFGDLVIMLPPQANRMHVAPVIQGIKEKMVDFNGSDWIVAVGDPTIFAICACLAYKKTGGHLRMLKWDRLTSNYISMETTI